MKTINIILFMLITISPRVSSQTAWYNQSSGTNAILQDVFFVDQDFGWVAGAHLILHTTDGGDTWIEQQAPPVSIFYIDVFFLDRMNGWACGNEAKIIHTTDGGNTWVNQPNPYTFPNPILYSIYFANADTGWALGGDHGNYPTFNNRQVVLYTTNGGNSWDFQYSASNKAPLYCANFISNTEGFAASEFGDVIHTSNGGITWIEKTPVSSYRLFGIYFADSNTGWATGEYLGVPHVASISKTTDGGITWNTQSFGTDEYIQDIYFIDDMIGWAVGGVFGGSGNSTILHTTNGGENWLSQTSPTTNALYGLSFAVVNHGWAVGFDGTIITTTNPVSVNENLTQPMRYDLFQNYPNPFNPATTIRYSMPEGGDVSLRIFNTLGEEVANLVNEYQQPGVYKVNFINRNLGTGIYFYRLNVNNYSSVKKMILLK